MNVFDIVGPVMIGPSSSHTAGAARIGRVAYKLLGEEAVKAQIRKQKKRHQHRRLDHQGGSRVDHGKIHLSDPLQDAVRYGGNRVKDHADAQP